MLPSSVLPLPLPLPLPLSLPLSLPLVSLFWRSSWSFCDGGPVAVDLLTKVRGVVDGVALPVSSALFPEPALSPDNRRCASPLFGCRPPRPHVHVHAFCQ